MTTDAPVPIESVIPPALHDVPLTLTVRIGTARKPMRELAALGEGSLMVLDTRITDPIEICVDDRVIARGELVESGEDGGMAVKLTELVATEA